MIILKNNNPIISLYSDKTPSSPALLLRVYTASSVAYPPLTLDRLAPLFSLAYSPGPLITAPSATPLPVS